MLDFFKTTYSTRKAYKLRLSALAEIIKSYESNPNVTELYYDQERNEGCVKSKSYFITFELHQIENEIYLDITTSAKLPFFIPRTYTRGFLQYIDTKIR